MIYKYQFPCLLPKVVPNSVYTYDIGESKASVLEESDNRTELDLNKDLGINECPYTKTPDTQTWDLSIPEDEDKGHRAR